MRSKDNPAVVLSLLKWQGTDPKGLPGAAHLPVSLCEPIVLAAQGGTPEQNRCNSAHAERKTIARRKGMLRTTLPQGGTTLPSGHSLCDRPNAAVCLPGAGPRVVVVEAALRGPHVPDSQIRRQRNAQKRPCNGGRHSWVQRPTVGGLWGGVRCSRRVPSLFTHRTLVEAKAKRSPSGVAEPGALAQPRKGEGGSLSEPCRNPVDGTLRAPSQ